MISIGKYKINDVLPYISYDKKLKKIKIFNGKKVKMFSHRYITFKEKGIKCEKCGIDGKFFLLERDEKMDSDKYHFNLYAIDKNGNNILMTKDHIIPKSKGGKSDISNYQTMCTKCNLDKADLI